MKHSICRRAYLMAVLALIAICTPAYAAINATQFPLPSWPSVRNAVAFDRVNQVYLMTTNVSPLTGIFLDRNGSPIGGAFAIASGAEGSFISWSQVAFGGPSNDPVFLVTYIGVSGSSYAKYGRLIRYRNGSAEVGPARFVTDTNGQWQAAEKAQNVWFADHFIVATRVVIGSLPQPIVQRFEMDGSVSGAVPLGDSLDFEGSPTLACAPTGVCLATGFAGAYPFGNGGSVFARLFHGSTLQPLSPLFYLDDHTSRMDDPWVVFNSVTGQFLTVWWQASYAQFRTVATDGGLGSYANRFGPWAGDLALRFNAATGTSLLTTKWANPATDPARWADLYAVEVDSEFRTNAVPIAAWDGKWPEFWASVAEDDVNGRWLVTSFETAGGHGAIVSGGAPAQAPPGAVPFDLNRDGKADLVWQNGVTGQLSGWFMDGVNLKSWGSLTPSVVGDTGWKIVGTPDFNRDGNADLLWRHDNGTVAYWLMAGDQVSSWGSIAAVGDTGWRIAATGDMNGDAWQDIIWHHLDGRVSYWYMEGVALRSGNVVAIVGDTSWRVVGAKDMNGDSKLDLVWHNNVSGLVSIWFMNNQTGLGSSVVDFHVADTNWRIVAFNDVNLDGKTDFVWQNQQNGYLAAWYMDGAHMMNGVWLNPGQVNDTNWRIVGPK